MRLRLMNIWARNPPAVDPRQKRLLRKRAIDLPPFYLLPVTTRKITLIGYIHAISAA